MAGRSLTGNAVVGATLFSTVASAKMAYATFSCVDLIVRFPVPCSNTAIARIRLVVVPRSYVLLLCAAAST